MKSLQIDDFREFFREVNDGNDPFPWQERLARQVCDSGQWPECLDLPTGTGKTAVLEIAIFHLALEAKRLAERRAPVRIAFVVDRRLIVDQTHTRAEKIQRLLIPGDSVAGRVAKELEFLAGEDKPCLLVQKLRGGIPRESDWARTPIQPTVLLSTVDQVGSRLLFRGYGVSPSMRPIHAGLLGSDCLIFLDEAHLSEPFRQSLRWIGRYREKPWSEFQPGPWATVSMSATPGNQERHVFSLNSHQDLENKILRRRLEASKPAELIDIPNTKVATAYAAMARKFAQEEGIYKVLIVVNRVDLARAIFEELQTDDPLLLTGRVREPDREEIVRKLNDRLSQPGEKLFAVATQCVEAGADLDFDALVTQIAPLDALRQRFGRLNRRGREIKAKAAILATKDDLPTKKPDPIYEYAAKRAWDLLKKIARSENERPVVDFGSAALNKALESEDIENACCEKPDAPVMPPAYIDLWTCTNPSPLVEPEVALFLHGPERGAPDVEIVWRADITQADLSDCERLKELLTLVPPRSAETLAVPVWKVRDWLAGETDAAIRLSDTEGEPETNERVPSSNRRVLRWLGPEDKRTDVVNASEIRAGDLVVVPASYGGCDEWGWTGKNNPAGRDVAEVAAVSLRAAEIAIRLHPSLFPAEWSAIRPLLEKLGDDAEQLRHELLDLDILPALLDAFAPRTAEVAFLYMEDEPGQGLVLMGRRSKKGRVAEPSTESDQAGNSADQPVSLADHTRAVTNQVTEFGERTGFARPVLHALKFAADLHDSGKGDRRFQDCLRNGVGGTEILAKSKPQRLGPTYARALQKKAGLPERWRHEALSVRVAIEDARFSSEEDLMDRELALWLVGTHHGYGRPFFPHDDPLDDLERNISGSNGQCLKLNPAPGPQRLDFEWNGLDWPSLHDLLRRRYGTWELARLEATLRLADHRASEE
jgi:CRISPR-associated endonuclease/helicase Cas3